MYNETARRLPIGTRVKEVTILRLILAILLILCSTTACFAEPIAYWQPGKSVGIELITCEDGQWEQREVNGREAAVLKRIENQPNYYLYFRFAPMVRERLDSEVYLLVDFLDEGISTVKTEFNSSAGSYTPGPGYILMGSGKWERGIIHLTNTEFAGLQNGGADFRFVCPSGSAIIARLEVYTQDPGVKLPTVQERIMNINWNTSAPKNMFYTFGNDADENTAPLYKLLGVTSIESYVTWETCERNGEGLWDWSRWDKQVKVLKENGLKWVPFLILGPAYSTPNWFRASREHFPCSCLEHGIDSKIESLWNPNLPKRIERFISEFAKRYGNSGVIESVLLGIHGDFGEAIYSVTGGGWTFHIPGEYHSHPGFWCYDRYALEDFRKFVYARYKTVDALNKAWGTSYFSIGDANFPGRKEELKAFRDSLPKGNPKVRRRWLDFVEWYRDAMTRWADWWIETARKYFPDTPIYLCTGGDAKPEHGSNFAEQCRVAAKHKAGVRITNEGSNYAANFALTRWVASAGKHYGAYFGFEPAGAEDEIGIVARIYNATASGANQLHDYSTNITNSSRTIDQQRKHIKYLFHVPKPIVPVALWYPNVSLTLEWSNFIAVAASLREYTDHDYVDETMLRTGALKNYKVLVIAHGNVMETADARKIAEWVKAGGVLVVMDVPRFESVEATSDPEVILFGDHPEGRTLGKGRVKRVKGWDALASELESVLGRLGYAICDMRKDGVFATQIEPDRFLFFNLNSSESTAEIRFAGSVKKFNLPAATIVDVKL
jgi:hypothetical protein